MPTKRTRPKAKPTKAAKAKPNRPAKAASNRAGKAKPKTPAKAKPTTPAKAKPTTPAKAKPKVPAKAKSKTLAKAKVSKPARAKVQAAPLQAPRREPPPQAMKSGGGTQLRLIDPPQITRTTAQATAFVHLTIPRDAIRTEMGPGISEVIGTCNSQGIAITGPWFTHHLRLLADRWDFEICVPVATPVKAAGRVRPGVRPALDVVQTIYRGGYEGLGEAWTEFKAWIAAQGLPAGPDIFECYLVGPESGPDASKYETELRQPLKR